MAWNAPAAGAMAYPQPYPHGQPVYSQPPYPPQTYGQPQQQAQSYPQPPVPYQAHPNLNHPQKKSRPVITRYPPPPGYQGQAQQPPHMAPNSSAFGPPWQPPQAQGYQSGYAAPPFQQQQSFSQAQAYGQGQGYPQAQAFTPQGHAPPPAGQFHQPPIPQQGPFTPTSTGYQQFPQSGLPQSPGFPPQPSGYQGYQSPAGSAAGTQQQYLQMPHGLPYPNGQPNFSQSGQRGTYGVPPPQVPAGTPATGKASPPSESVRLFKPKKAGTRNLDIGQDDEWEYDFDGPIWPKNGEDVDPNFSLGVITWRAPKQGTRALPSSYEAAEEQALKPPAPKLGNGESVSIYFTCENAHEAFLDIRQTDIWEKIKDDPIFVEFPPNDAMDLIPLEQCIAQRDRPDFPVTEEPEGDNDEMECPHWNVMDNLEQALSSAQDANVRKEQEPASHPTNVKSGSMFLSQEQEDVLANLGVSGSPKPVTDSPVEIPFPSVDDDTAGPPAPALPSTELTPQRSKSFGGHRSAPQGQLLPRPYGSLSSATKAHVPPQPSAGRQRFGSQSAANGRSSFDGRPQSPARSDSSHHTLAGSDFGPDPQPAFRNGAGISTEPGPTLLRSESSLNRKRSLEESDEGENLRQDDDRTRRNKRRHPPVAAAYGRR